MKIVFKTPDAVDYALEAIYNEDDRVKAEAVLNKYIKYGEIIIIDFDLEEGTATVVPV